MGSTCNGVDTAAKVEIDAYNTSTKRNINELHVIECSKCIENCKFLGKT